MQPAASIVTMLMQANCRTTAQQLLVQAGKTNRVALRRPLEVLELTRGDRLEELMGLGLQVPSQILALGQKDGPWVWGLASRTHPLPCSANRSSSWRTNSTKPGAFTIVSRRWWRSRRRGWKVIVKLKLS